MNRRLSRGEAEHKQECAMDTVYFGAVDLGGTKVTTLIADQGGKIIARLEEPLTTRKEGFAPWRDGIGYSGIAFQIEEMLRRMMGSVETCTLAAIGIGSAGPLAGGALVNPPNITVPEIPEELPRSPLYIPLVAPLHSAFSTPIRLENDCNTAVLGEVLYGVGKGREDKESLHIVYVTFSTGLGAGVWTGGRLLLGKDGNAAEIGHIVVKEGGLRCGCGNLGCAEAYCSGNGIERNARMRLKRAGFAKNLLLIRLAKAAADTAGLPVEREDEEEDLLALITPSLVFQAAKEGDPIACEVIAEVTHYGGIILAAIANAYDPDVITLGGSIAIEQAQLIDPMREEMLCHLNVAPPTVRITPLKKQAVEYGAVALAQRAYSLDLAASHDSKSAFTGDRLIG